MTAQSIIPATGHTLVKVDAVEPTCTESGIIEHWKCSVCNELFSDEAERIYQAQGLEAFAAHELANARKPLPEGPFAKLLRSISTIQKQYPTESSPIRTALVTARNAPAHERVIRTLRAWDVRIDEAFFLGGIQKSDILKAFDANIFFDDQTVHTDPASKVVPAARVPYAE